MTHYSDYEFYTNTFGGAMTEQEYNRYVNDATAYINATVGLIPPHCLAEMENNLSMCECALADNAKYFAMLPKGIKSENNDGYSVTYASSEEGESTINMQILHKWLTFPCNLLMGWA